MDVNETLFLNATIMVEFLQKKLADAGFYAQATRLRALEITDHTSAQVAYGILEHKPKLSDPELGEWWDLVRSNVERALPAQTQIVAA
jgi:hypothetical protein